MREPSEPQPAAPAPDHYSANKKPDPSTRDRAFCMTWAMSSFLANPYHAGRNYGEGSRQFVLAFLHDRSDDAGPCYR